jgi:hypothetical protein
VAQPDPPHADKGRTILDPLFSYHLNVFELIRTDHGKPSRQKMAGKLWEQCPISLPCHDLDYTRSTAGITFPLWRIKQGWVK